MTLYRWTLAISDEMFKSGTVRADTYEEAVREAMRSAHVRAAEGGQLTLLIHKALREEAE